jgi:hypothetical protein
LDPSWASLEVQPAFVAPLQDPTTGQRSSIWCRLCQTDSLGGSGCGPQFLFGPNEPALASGEPALCTVRDSQGQVEPLKSSQRPTSFKEETPRDKGHWGRMLLASSSAFWVDLHEPAVSGPASSHLGSFKLFWRPQFAHCCLVLPKKGTGFKFHPIWTSVG